MSGRTCIICKKSLDDRHIHTIRPTYSEKQMRDGALLSFIVDMSTACDNPSDTAWELAYARKELKEYFPGKTFEIQPARMMLSRLTLGQAYVVTYAVFET
ncbi:MAG: hypothetical protein KBE09_05525 [Candidatus Pacebacteria bacterium]|nr:hypothetical protein [Candidatus Paceibacterota bacterium]